MKTSEIADRTKAFAVRIFKLAEALPKNFTGKTIAAQIVRVIVSIIKSTVGK